MGDHIHKFGKLSAIKPYRYENAEKLMSDFWAAVDEVVHLDKG